MSRKQLRNILCCSAALLLFGLLVPATAIRNADAVGGDEITAVDFGGRFDYVATANGDVYLGEHNTPDGVDARWTLIGNVGSASPIVQIQDLFSNAEHEYVWAYSADGGLFVSDDNGRTWNPRGNVFASLTPSRIRTWGGLKMRYR